jgi:hypothetical protein
MPRFLSRLPVSPAVPFLTAMVVLAGWAGLAGARTEPLGERVTVKVSLPASPARNDATARRSIAMLDKAALVACGGSDNSFPQMKAAVRQSTCWRTAMSSAVGQSHDARLSAWWAAHHL